jgi:hypothetical protein
MKNKIIASLYFGKHSTILIVLERNDNGYTLLYIKNLDNILDLNAISADNSTAAINEISKILSQFNISDFFVTLNPSYYIATQIPGSLKENKNEFIRLVDMSIKQHNPIKRINDFRIKSIPVNSALQTELVTIIDKNIIIAIESIVAMFGYEVTDINPTHIAAINAYNFNYPEKIVSTSILVQLLDNVFEFGIISNNKILGYEYCIIENNIPISTIVENKLNQIVQNYNSININCIYYYGDTLTKKEYVECWEIGMIISGDSKRLNPLRLMSSNLEQRDKDYCARMFQILTPCIGGALPTQIYTETF